jgi:hypothetical protein
MTTKHEVVATHREHPDWNCVQIAEHLGCEGGYVRATFKRNGLKPSGTRRVAPPWHRPVSAAQRERCAKLCERMGLPDAAAAIREGAAFANSAVSP